MAEVKIKLLSYFFTDSHGWTSLKGEVRNIYEDTLSDNLVGLIATYVEN